MAIHRKDLVCKYTCDAEAIELKIFQCDSGMWIILLDSFVFSLTCIMQVTYKEEHTSFLHFLTNVCAIIGGNY